VIKLGRVLVKFEHVIATDWPISAICGPFAVGVARQQTHESRHENCLEMMREPTKRDLPSPFWCLSYKAKSRQTSLLDQRVRSGCGKIAGALRGRPRSDAREGAAVVPWAETRRSCRRGRGGFVLGGLRRLSSNSAGTRCGDAFRSIPVFRRTGTTGTLRCRFVRATRRCALHGSCSALTVAAIAIGPARLDIL
jgi:hypothetical protein